MAKSVLDTIVERRKERIEIDKTRLPIALIEEQLTVSMRSLEEALRKPGPQFILECKKASPSRGLLREDFDIEKILTVYNDYAAAISVLTEPDYFQGADANLTLVKQQSNKPVLCKDFIFDEYQILKARYYGADAVLLMLSVLDDDDYRSLHKVATKWQMDVLTEVHTEEELHRATQLGAKIIGINNRNLKDLSIDIETSMKLSAKNTSRSLLVSESGIQSYQHIKHLASSVDAFLVGSALMSIPNLRKASAGLTHGDIKVCGLMHADIAQIAARSGARYGGLIFAPKSIRAISVKQAKLITEAADLDFVGVFVNQPIPEIVQTAALLKLFAVQLHGQENDAYRAELRRELPKGVEIWQAIPGNEVGSIELVAYADRTLLDSKAGDAFGGTGQVLSWQDIPEKIKQDQRFILAGGLSPNNIIEARQNFSGILDVNSGVESVKGYKDSVKISQLFAQLRDDYVI
ncbi:MAG: bifunctional indole-3-glycerol-phosphate synthase TrpC/phosphoribosylanthranilate isomerase TrpF [Pseudomonadota bacterium]